MILPQCSLQLMSPSIPVPAPHPGSGRCMSRPPPSLSSHFCHLHFSLHTRSFVLKLCPCHFLDQDFQVLQTTFLTTKKCICSRAQFPLLQYNAGVESHCHITQSKAELCAFPGQTQKILCKQPAYMYMYHCITTIIKQRKKI